MSVEGDDDVNEEDGSDNDDVDHPAEQNEDVLNYSRSVPDSCQATYRF